MNHKHIATDLFPTWYKSIDPQVPAIIVGYRIEAIKKLLTIEDLSFWIDLVRVALNLSPANDNTLDILVKEFKESDINFPLTANENLLAVLSRILLAFLFESSNKNRRLVAEAVTNIVFFGQFDASDVPYYGYACEVLNENSTAFNDINDEANNVLITLRQTLNENSGEDDAILLDDADHLAVLSSVEFLMRQNLRLKEETNVLWWLFGGFSRLLDEYFQIVGVPAMVLAAPKELADFSGERYRFLAAKYLLSKALNMANEGKLLTIEYSVAEIIDAVEPSLVNKVLSGLPTPSELTPCLYALFLSSQFDESAIWKAAFQKKIKDASIDKKFGAAFLAYQLYNEILFLSQIEPTA